MIAFNLTNVDVSCMSGHLQMGGRNPDGVEINANSRCLTYQSEPWLPVMGEFHYSRCPRSEWEDELIKMKAGGIDIVGTYLFWIHHEIEEGQVNWSDNRDLRRFVSLCAQHGLYVFLRIGPWAHGEARNGGFPDWLLQRCGAEVRKDAQPYLTYVRRWFEQIYDQVKSVGEKPGLLWKDGGPVIGIQLENELINDADHIRTLKKLALEVGLEAPLYTMTGWGPAQVPQDEVIPVFGGYPDAFWDRQTETWSRGSRKHYFFSSIRDDNTIGNDLHANDGAGDLSYLDRYPFGTCETGGGMSASYHRRALIRPEDVSAIALCKIGNGSNLQGYYMYHGGSHPHGQDRTMQESQRTGYWNGLPVINYDFQAPLGQYGQVRRHYHQLRLLHLFLHEFGSKLAPMPMTLPDILPTGLDDRSTLRCTVRSDGKSGFLFINNYQRRESLPDHNHVQFHLALPDGPLNIPAAPVTIETGITAVWPFGQDLGGLSLQYATAQPICRVDSPDGPCFVFMETGGITPQFVFPGKVQAQAVMGMIGITKEDEGVIVTYSRPRASLTPGCFEIYDSTMCSVRFLILSQEQALQCWKGQFAGQERIFLSPASMLIEDGSTSRGRLRLRATTSQDLWVNIYPPVDRKQITGDGISVEFDGIFTRCIATIQEKFVEVIAQCVKDAGAARTVSIGAAGVAQAPEEENFAGAEVWQVTFPADTLEGICDVYLRVEWVGDVARAYIGDRLIADDFSLGQHPGQDATWEIALRRFAPDVLEQGLQLRFLPLREDAPIYLDPEARPAFQDEKVLEVISISPQALYEVEILYN